MQRLAAWVMVSRWRAILAAILCAAVAVILPPFTSPFSYLGGAVVALVALRLGALEGLSVILAGSLGLGLLGTLSGGLAGSLIVGTLVLWVPVWLFALLLRASRSLALTLQGLLLFGMTLVILAHLWLGQPANWWQPRIETVLTPFFAQEGVDGSQYIAELARWMTGLIVAAVVLSLLLSLLLGRAWQASLYNPGGLGEEFRGLALGRGLAMLSLVLLSLTLLNWGRVSLIAADTLPTLLVLYAVQGLAVAHALLKRSQARRGWLAAVYVLLFVAAPQMLPLLALFGWMDAWIDMRTRFGARD